MEKERYEESELYRIRHSSAHVMAQAVVEMFPGEAKVAIGPPIAEGFYYDFDLPRPLAPEDLEVIEGRMREIIEGDFEFEKQVVSADEAKELFKDQPYKIELIEGLEAGGVDEYGEPTEEAPVISTYTHDTFTDLCRGPHLERTGQINPGAFKLLNVAGAYWRGDENRPMLQRIYGTAWKTSEELEQHLWKLEEAKKRDHRVLGRELDLYSVSEDVGPGLILWHPKGGMIRKLADEALENAKGNYDSLSGRSSDDPARALALVNWVNAQKARDSALRNLNWFTGHPTESQQAILDAEVEAAETQVQRAELDVEKWSAGPETDALVLAEARIANAEAQLEAAQAQLEAELDAIDFELDKYLVLAPVSGVVIVRNVEPGELILPGAPAMTIGQLDKLTLTVYLPEDRYGQVSLGDTAPATVDSYPGESFEVIVTRIADRAEFTPRNVQTEEDRRSTAYAIVLRVDDPDGKLKPGMPADVTFGS